MSTTYKRLINEYIKLIEDINVKKDFNNLVYKIYIINNDNFLYKTILNFIYKKNNYKVEIFYNKYYPFEPPKNISINNTNIIKIYSQIMKNNTILFNNKCLSCESYLCNENWCVNYTIINLLKEIKKTIDYKKLYIERKLLDTIIDKFCPNIHLEYLHYYLL